MRLHLLTALPENNFRSLPDLPGDPREAVTRYVNSFKELNTTREQIVNNLQDLLEQYKENNDPKAKGDLEFVMRTLSDFNLNIQNELRKAKEDFAKMEKPKPDKFEDALENQPNRKEA